jgi:hypothetical protein
VRTRACGLELFPRPADAQFDATPSHSPEFIRARGITF